MDSIRAKEILRSPQSIQVLHNGTPVWIENVKENNTAEVTNLESKKREVVPVYTLIENQSSR